MKKIIITILFLICILAELSFAGVLETHFDKANELYAQNDFEGASGLYKKIYEQGFYSKELFYNMSNTYYRLGQTGQAMRYIEKAYRFSPRDKDIRFNKKFLLNTTGQTEDVWNAIIGYLSINELGIICLFLYSIVFIILIINRFYKQRWLFWIKFSTISLGIIFGCWLYMSYLKFYKNTCAIVISEEANVYSAPGQDQAVSFTVPNAMKVIILEQNNGWFDIGVQEKGLRGWIEKDKLGII